MLTTYSVRWKTVTSQTVTVQVRPKVTLTRTSRTRLFAKFAATPSFAGRTIYVQRRSKFGQWVTVREAEARSELGAHLHGAAREGDVDVSRLHDNQPGGHGLPRHVEQFRASPLPPLRNEKDLT